MGQGKQLNATVAHAISKLARLPEILDLQS